MFCPNCGKGVNGDSNYCGQCGYKMNTVYPKKPKTFDHSLNAETEFKDDVLDFVGKNNDYYKLKWQEGKQKNGISINIAALFFSTLWLGYRKMYKTVFIVAIIFLLLDFILYLVGYEYSFEHFMDPIDRAIVIGTAVFLGFYGNKLYKKHTERTVQKIRDAKENPYDRQNYYREKGGTSWFGPIIAFLIIALVYGIPAKFIPINVNEIDEVRFSIFIEYPDTSIGDMFDEVFDDGEWNSQESYDDTATVDYHGKILVDNQSHSVIIRFQTTESKEPAILSIKVDGEELNAMDTSEFLEFVFREHASPE